MVQSMPALRAQTSIGCLGGSRWPSRCQGVSPVKAIVSMRCAIGIAWVEAARDEASADEVAGAAPGRVRV
ncbi:hypothetical protein D9M69_627930 [compost metagenome]